MVSPLMLLTALLIKLDSRGPVFFYQTRNGFNDRAFRIVKFRTMHVLEDGDSIRQATRDDPRITELGRWLRRTNIDELPQLFNVLSGNMSLIGPRPHAAAHNSEYENSSPITPFVTTSSLASRAGRKLMAIEARHPPPSLWQSASNSISGISTTGACGWISESCFVLWSLASRKPDTKLRLDAPLAGF